MKNTKRPVALALLSASFAQCASAAIIPINFQVNTLTDVKNIVYGISAGVGAVMIVLHVFKWLTADDEEGRLNARNNIAYVLFALLVLALAGVLVGMFYSAPTAGYT
jgi:formate-dependent nitrite reductase membrane component NrfD